MPPAAATSAGFREIEHRADWELEVWAADFSGLLEQAARGMYTLVGARLNPANRIQIELEFGAPDAESLLVNFLAELLFLIETQNLAFDEFQLELDGYALSARLGGASLAHIDKEIKAVTYHQLAVLQTEDGFLVRIVFDG